MQKRLGLDAYFLSMAIAAAARSTCPRRSVGAVLTKDGKVLSTGYNGAPRGMPHCTDVGCLMTSGDRPTCMRTTHAELNALLQSSEHGDTIYCTDQPCLMCFKAIVNCGVKRIVYLAEYDDPLREEFLRHWLNVNIEVVDARTTVSENEYEVLTMIKDALR